MKESSSHPRRNARIKNEQWINTLGGEKGYSRRPKGGHRSNQSFSGALTKKPERAGKTDNTVEPQLTPERLDNAEEGAVAIANTVVDLEGFTTCYRRNVDKIGSNTILLLSSIPYHWIGTMGRCQVIRLF